MYFFQTILFIVFYFVDFDSEDDSEGSEWECSSAESSDDEFDDFARPNIHRTDLIPSNETSCLTSALHRSLPSEDLIPQVAPYISDVDNAELVPEVLRDSPTSLPEVSFANSVMRDGVDGMRSLLDGSGKVHLSFFLSIAVVNHCLPFNILFSLLLIV